MFDMGFVEMLLIGVVALVVVGPERLPSVARTVGTYVAKIRRFVSNAKSDIEQEFRTDELQKMLQSQQDELQSLKELVGNKDEMSALEKSFSETVSDVSSNSSSDLDTDDFADDTKDTAAKSKVDKLEADKPKAAESKA